MNNELVHVIDDDDIDTPTREVEAWKIAIIDDEEGMHEVTKLALLDVEILGKPLAFYSAHSGEEGLQLLIDEPDMAAVLLDVVMESHDAGLKLAARIRNELKNKCLQIILRTGQPGYAPEEEIIQQYEINDYKTKDELTRNKLITSIATAVRSFHHLSALEVSKTGLESIVSTCASLFKERSIDEFSRGVLTQINALFDINAQGMFCVSQKPSKSKLRWCSTEKDGYFVIAATKKFQGYFGREITYVKENEQQDIELVLEVLEKQQHVFRDNLTCFYLSTPSGWHGAIVFEQAFSLSRIDKELLTIFCLNVSLGLENAKFYTHLTNAAYKDSLTGLLSRIGLAEKLPIDVEEKKCYLHVIDIDHFRDITQNFGYDYGDKLLTSFARNLKKNYSKNSYIARLHSDVFAVLFVSDDNTMQPSDFVLSNLIEVDNSSIRIGVSMGSSSYQPNQASVFDIEVMLRQAEMAMKVAKSSRRGKSQQFSSEFEDESKNRLILLNDLRAAMVNDELFIHLQPKVNILNGEIIGYEALLRWLHPVKGMISPASFIPLAEKSGMYFDLDIYVFNKCLSLIEQNPKIDKPVSINLSAHSVAHVELVEELEKKLASSTVNLANIELEITESALVSGDIAVTNLKRFKEKGFVLCLDDFGAGYSSMSYLLKLPFDIIKIDRSFVIATDFDKRALIVLKSMLEMALSLGRMVIVEGVETLQQVELLKTLGVSYVQGFYFYKPMSISDIERKILVNAR